ncbi:hypothetical protein KWH19_20385 [Xanthomonas campestris pv. pennamericanum]|uniref:hypothetical protein n=1 Tax=Xanthomonas euvesicatoria TaxID=456327 RepID=UPI001C46A473|nr:hypothetical protein [Xanthomonas euvesicatoria]MBV6812053.1 hypothetical protein [Xanthomonas campestris pv. pennamericanum]
MKLIALLWDRFDPDRSRIKRDVEGAVQNLDCVEREVELLRASIQSLRERSQLLETKVSDYQAELDRHKALMKSIGEAQLRQAESSLSGDPSIFKILLSLFIVLVICGVSVVLNPAVDHPVVDYALFNLPILAAILAGLGFFVRKDKLIFGRGADGFFFCFAVLLLVGSVAAYAFDKGYLKDMVLHTIGVYPAVIFSWIALGVRRRSNQASTCYALLLPPTGALMVVAFRWIYVVNEYNPHSLDDILLKLIPLAWLE